MCGFLRQDAWRLAVGFRRKIMDLLRLLHPRGFAQCYQLYPNRGVEYHFRTFCTSEKIYHRDTFLYSIDLFHAAYTFIHMFVEKWQILFIFEYLSALYEGELTNQLG